MAEELAERANIPSIPLYVIRQSSPCAFITGATRRDHAIIFSPALLSLLSQTELAGVMAHCLLRIRFGDALPLILAAKLPRLLAKILAPAGQWYRADAASVFLLGDDMPLRSALEKLANAESSFDDRFSAPAIPLFGSSDILPSIEARFRHLDTLRKVAIIDSTHETESTYSG
jgi:Zn-dependent protease with chaperone function